jgi:hypothetical protein
MNIDNPLVRMGQFWKDERRSQELRSKCSRNVGPNYYLVTPRERIGTWEYMEN